VRTTALRKILYFTKDEYYCDKVVLSVQDLWRVYRSFTPSLRGCHRLVECDFSVDWVMPRKVSDLLGSWRRQLGNRNVLNIWMLALLCLMWCLLRERNARALTIVRMDS